MWKQITGTNKYLVNELGELLNVSTNKVSAGYNTSQGYKELRVQNSTRKTTYRRLVHVIVYETFIGQIPNGLVIDHIDNNKANNALANLQLLTRAANSSKGSLMRDASITYKKVAQYTLAGAYVATHNSIKEACIAIGVNSRSPLISYACHGRCSTNNCNTAYGYKWKFVSDDIVQSPQ